MGLFTAEGGVPKGDLGQVLRLVFRSACSGARQAQVQVSELRGRQYMRYNRGWKSLLLGCERDGKLGNGTKVDSIAPVEVLASSKFQMISVGDAYACAITTDGSAVCWGLNGDGELGNNTFKSSSVPVTVAGSLRFSSVATNYSRTIGITTNGAAYTWGMEKEKTDDTDVQHSAAPRAAPRDSDLASVEGSLPTALAVISERRNKQRKKRSRNIQTAHLSYTKLRYSSRILGSLTGRTRVFKSYGIWEKTGLNC